MRRWKGWGEGDDVYRRPGVNHEPSLSQGSSFLRTLASEELGECLATASELVIDYALEPGVWREVPVVGSVQRIVQVVADVRSKLFLRRLTAFLAELDTATPAERERFANQFSTEAQKDAFGTHVLLYIDQSDDIRKPAIIGRLMVACIRGHLPLGDTKRLCAMVNRCYADDLKLLTRFTDGVQGENTPIAESLQAVGFLSHGGTDGGEIGVPESGGSIFEMNRYGRWLVKYGDLTKDD